MMRRAALFAVPGADFERLQRAGMFLDRWAAVVRDGAVGDHFIGRQADDLADFGQMRLAGGGRAEMLDPHEPRLALAGGGEGVVMDRDEILAERRAGRAGAEQKHRAEEASGGHDPRLGRGPAPIKRAIHLPFRAPGSDVVTFHARNDIAALREGAG